MSLPDGTSFALVGALAAFPRRLAAREVAARGGSLHHGVTRATTHVVLGRGLLNRGNDPALRQRVAGLRRHHRPLLGERAFLRLLGLAPPAQATPAGLGAAALTDRSNLAPEAFEVLALFDAFEADAAPFGLRDLILARKYAGLLAGGATAFAVLRAIHRLARPVSLTARALEMGGGAILAREGDRLAELDGQMPLALDATGADPDEAFADAEAAEAAGRVQEAVALYGRCLALDPEDAVAAFNRANCLAAAGRAREAEAEHLRALKLDPGLVEARFNLAGLLAADGRADAARRHLAAALARDPGYADAVYNLALLDHAAGDHEAAARHWRRYLELDSRSDWAATARRGLQVLAMRTVSDLGS